MSPWVTILEVLFIAPHFPRPALTPTAFLCFCVRPRKLPFLVCIGLFISLFYHGAPEPPKHWGLPRLIPKDSLLIYRAAQQHIQLLFSAPLLLPPLELHRHLIKPTQRGLNGLAWGSWGCLRSKRTIESLWRSLLDSSYLEMNRKTARLKGKRGKKIIIKT